MPPPAEARLAGRDKGRGGSEIEVEMESERECDSDAPPELGLTAEDILIKTGMSRLAVHAENIDTW